MRNILLTVLFMAPIAVGYCMQKSVTQEFKLDNGLVVVVREDHRSPAVVAQMWYRVGSADEHGGITGISHALEHMMFLGTQAVPQDQFSKKIGSLGGYENAFTSEDQTVYYEEIGKQHLETCLVLEADRMKHLQFNPEEVQRELEVIKEERRLRVEDDPQSLTWERFMAAANVGGAYHNPVIGWMEDIKQLSVNDLKDWYEKWYAPNFATLVVVGDVKAEEVYALAQKYFGHIPASLAVKPKAKPQVTPLGKRMIEVHAKANLPFLMLGYDVPSFSSKELEPKVYALMVLQSVLDGGLSARFEKELVRSQAVAAEVGANYDPYQRYNTQFIISATPSEDTDKALLLKGIETEINKLATTLVSEDELKRAKMNLVSGYIYEKDSTSQQAMLLGKLKTLDLNINMMDDFESKIQSITAKDVQAVAKEYFNDKRQTIAWLIPETLA